MSKDLEIAYLCDQVYLPKGGNPPSGWKILCTSDDVKLSKEGFFATAYFNEKRNEVVIAYRGTCNVNNIDSDYNLWWQKLPSAHQYAEKFVTLVAAKKEVSQQKSQITHTGHSLGGFHALMNGLKDSRQTIVFDTPSTVKLFQKELDVKIDVDPTKNSFAHIKTYLSVPNLVNHGDQIGDVIQLELTPELEEKIKLREEKLSGEHKNTWRTGLLGLAIKYACVTGANQLTKHQLSTIIANLADKEAKLQSIVKEHHLKEIERFNREQKSASESIQKKIQNLKSIADQAHKELDNIQQLKINDQSELRHAYYAKLDKFYNKRKKVWKAYSEYSYKLSEKLSDYKKKHPNDEKGYAALEKQIIRERVKTKQKIRDEWGDIALRSFGFFPMDGRIYCEIMQKQTQDMSDLETKYDQLKKQQEDKCSQANLKYQAARDNELKPSLEEWGDGNKTFEKNTGSKAKELREKHKIEMEEFKILEICYKLLEENGITRPNFEPFTDRIDSNIATSFWNYLLSPSEGLQENDSKDVSSELIDELATHYDTRYQFDDIINKYLVGSLSKDGFIHAINAQSSEAKRLYETVEALQSTCKDEKLVELNFFKSLLDKDIEYYKQISADNIFEAKLTHLKALAIRSNEKLHLIEFNFARKRISKDEYLQQIQAYLKNNAYFDELVQTLQTDEQCSHSLKNIISFLSESCKKSEIITFHNYAIAKNDLQLLKLTYDREKLLPEEDRLPYMESSLHAIEAIQNKKRIVDMEIAHPDAQKALEIEKWLEILRMRLARREQWRQQIDKQNDPVEKAKFEALYAQDTEDTENAIKTTKQQIEYSNNADTLLQLSRLNYAHLGVDLAMNLFADKIQKLLGTTPGVVKSLINLVDTGIAMQKNELSEALKLGRIDANKLLEKIGNVDEIQAKDLEAILNPTTESGLLNGINNFLNKYNSHILKFRLAVAVIDLLLEDAYAKYLAAMQAKGLDPKPYEEWLNSSNFNNYLHAFTNNSKTGLIYLSQGQTFLQLGQLLSAGSKGDTLTLVRETANALLCIPYLAEYVSRLSASITGEEDNPTNWYTVFSLCLLKNMICSNTQQLLITHEGTLLHGVREILQRATFLNVAMQFSLFIPKIQNIIFIARLIYATWLTLEETDQIVVENRILNIKAKIAKIGMELSQCKDENETQLALCKASDIFCDIKYDAKNLGRDHIDQNHLYVYALFNQHLLNNTIELIPCKGDGNGFFQAVSCYTSESPASLRELAAAHIEKERYFFEDFISAVSIGKKFADYVKDIRKQGTFADELILRALTKVLQRPIIILFSNTPMDNIMVHLNRQLLGQPGTIIKGDPIFVAYEPDTEQYHCLQIPEEMYFVTQLTKKLKETARIKKVACTRSLNDEIFDEEAQPSWALKTPAEIAANYHTAKKIAADKLCLKPCASGKKSRADIQRDFHSAKQLLAKKNPGIFSSDSSLPVKNKSKAPGERMLLRK